MGATRPESEPRRRGLVRAATSGALGLALVVGLLLFLGPRTAAEGPPPPDPGAEAWLRDAASRVPAVKPPPAAPLVGVQSVTTLTVCPGGDCDYTTIQAAINAAPAPADILVAAGTYHEAIMMREGVSLYGNGWDTVIDGDFALGTLVCIPSDVQATTVFSGFLVTEGGDSTTSGWDGGGFLIYGSPRVVNTLVYSCTGRYGGGLYISGGDPILDNVPVLSCLAARGGAFYVTNGAGPTIYTSNPFVDLNGMVLWNIATSQGGGICINNASALVGGLRMYWNDAPYGGGVWIGNNSAPFSVTFALNDIFATTASHDGAGLEVSSASAVDISGNLIRANTATDNGGGVHFHAAGGRLWVNLLSENQANKGGGGSVTGVCPGLTIQGNRFEGNTADDAGGLSVETGDGLTVDANVFSSNTGARASGVYLYGAGAVTVTNNILAYNVCTSDNGGAISIDQSPAHVINNTVADNSGDGIYFSAAENATIVNNILSGNRGFEMHAGALPTAYLADYNDVYDWDGCGARSGVAAGAHDLALDPVYVAAGDLAAYFHLRHGSPLNGTGSTAWAPERDYDGQYRRTGGTVSMGADERPWLFYHLPLVRRP